MSLIIQMNKKINLIVIIIGCCLTTVANAQIEEVVVTAQKRTESVQEVPLTVTAFDTDAIRASGLQNVEDVAALIPNLQVQDNGILARFSLRGINLNSLSDASESPIAIYNDGVYLGSSSNFRSSLFDLERIEVIRGPQGTLYGRNATGGLLNFISKEPTDEFEGYASVQYGRFNELIAEGAVGGPIGDNVRARISVKGDIDDGYQTNVVDGSDWAETDAISGRFQLAIDLSNDIEVLFNIHGFDTDNISPGYGLFGNRDPSDPTLLTMCSIDQIFSNACVDETGERGTGKPTKIQSSNQPPSNNREQYGGFVRITWNVNDNVTVTSLTAYEDISKDHNEDGEGSISQELTVGAEAEYDQWSQELRLNGAYDAFDWVAGFYYFKSDAGAVGRAGFSIPEPDPLFLLADSTVDTEAWAVFADVKYAVTEQINISAGLRYTDEEKHHDGENVFPAFFGAAPAVIDFSAKEDLVTWRAAADWSVTADAMLYFNFSTGFKSPGFNTQYIFSTDPFAASASDREDVDAFEIGLKSYLFDKRVLFNVAGFYYDYQGLQQILTVPSPTPAPGGGTLNTPVLSNVEQADILGAEIEFSFVPSDRWEFSATLGVMDTEVDDPDPGFDGNKVAAAPELNYTLLGRHHVPLGGLGTATLQVSYRWQDDVYFGVDNDPLEIFDSYGVANARLIWRSADERYTLEGFVDNLADEEYFVHAFSSSGGTGVVGSVGIWGLPRTYGVRARIDF